MEMHDSQRNYGYSQSDNSDNLISPVTHTHTHLLRHTLSYTHIHALIHSIKAKMHVSCMCLCACVCVCALSTEQRRSCKFTTT